MAAAPKRKSLREINTLAIARPTDAPSPTEDTPPPGPAPTAGGTLTPRPRKAAAKRERGDLTRIGIYIHPAQYNDAKAAYLADWQAGGQDDTFARWVGSAIEAHARKTPDERAQLARPQERADTSGGTRAFDVPNDTIARMREAIGADQQAGRWPSDSAWCLDAIAAAVDHARQRDGGLPTPPTRLPNRLVRA